MNCQKIISLQKFTFFWQNCYSCLLTCLQEHYSINPLNTYKVPFSHRELVFVFMSTWAPTWQGEGMGQLNAQCGPAYELTSSVNKTSLRSPHGFICQIIYVCFLPRLTIKFKVFLCILSTTSSLKMCTI